MNVQKKTIEVVAAIIIRDGKFFAKQSRRRIIDHLQGLFPDVDRAKIEKLILT